MSINLKTVDFQRAIDELGREIKKWRGGKYALVGIHEDAGKVEGEQMTEAELGALQHFGTDGPPKIRARPWLDVGVKSDVPTYLDYVRVEIGKGSNMDQVIEGVGILAAGATQQYITDLKTPSNAPFTIAKKGSDNPLIDTGRMRASVTSTVTDEKPTEGL